MQLDGLCHNPTIQFRVSSPNDLQKLNTTIVLKRRDKPCAKTCKNARMSPIEIY